MHKKEKHQQRRHDGKDTESRRIGGGQQPPASTQYDKKNVVLTVAGDGKFCGRGFSSSLPAAISRTLVWSCIELANVPLALCPTF